MPAARRRPEAAQNRLLLRIYQLSRRFAWGRVAAQDVDDVVHDVALECLECLRSGSWAGPPRNLQAFVRKLVRARIADRFRKQECNREHDGENLRARKLSRPDWMAPGRIWTDAAIAELQEQVMATLTRRCRMAYCMVRVEGSSYEEAARRLRVSRDVVHKEVTRAQRAFREELERIGAGPLPLGVPASRDRTGWGRDGERFSPAYVARKQAAVGD